MADTTRDQLIEDYFDQRNRRPVLGLILVLILGPVGYLYTNVKDAIFLIVSMTVTGFVSLYVFLWAPGIGLAIVATAFWLMSIFAWKARYKESNAKLGEEIKLASDGETEPSAPSGAWMALERERNHVRNIFRIFTGYLIANLAFFLFDPFSSPWRHPSNPAPIDVEREGDEELLLADITAILDEIDLAYGRRAPTRAEETRERIKNTVEILFFPASSALLAVEYLGTSGAGLAFELAVMKRYNHLAKLAITKGMERDGYLYAEDLRADSGYGLSFEDLRIRMAKPDEPHPANRSFEQPPLKQNAWVNETTAWHSVGSAFIGRLIRFSADGEQHLGIEQGASVFQDLGAVYQPNSHYFLRVSVGNRPNWTQEGNRSTIALTTANGSEIVAQSFDASEIPAGTFRPMELRVDTSESVELVGQRIGILLKANGRGRSHFDDVQLIWERNE